MPACRIAFTLTSRPHRRSRNLRFAIALDGFLDGLEKTHRSPALRGVRIGGAILQDRPRERLDLVLVRVAVAAQGRMPPLRAAIEGTDLARAVIEGEESADLDARVLA